MIRSLRVCGAVRWRQRDGCPVPSTPVCQCEKKPYAACREAGRK